MMGGAYRDARVEDAAAVGAFLHERFVATFGYLYPPDDLAVFTALHYTPTAIEKGLRAPTGANHLALQDDGPNAPILGVAEIGPLGLPVDAPADERAYELKRLYLADAVKGAGVADALMRWSFDRAALFGAKVMYLSVWSENFRAQKFYARHGFVKCGAYKFPVGATLDDEWIMRAVIESGEAP